MSKEENKLSGKALNLTDLNLLLYGDFDPDYPSAKYMESPSEQYFRDKVNMRRKGTGKIILTSTPAENDNDAFEFYKQWWQKK